MDPNQLTPEQVAQIATWVAQRDVLLLEIAALRTDKEKLTLDNKNLAESNTDIESRVNKLTGRLEELDKKEKDYINIVSAEIIPLTDKKGKLESQITGLEKEVGLLESKKKLITETIATLTALHDKVFERAGKLDQVVERVIRINADNITQIDTMVSKLNISVQKVIDTSNQSVDDVNRILEKLPRMFVELKRASLVRPDPVLNKAREEK